MPIEGLRVVRGSDWNHGTEDGGEGHVGTVSQDNQDGSVEVQWDMGGETTCDIGKSGKLDLLVLDSAPAGVTHKGVECSSCSQKDIAGARWKCTTCKSCDLCTPCYFHDKHDIQHIFSRIDTSGATGQRVSKRSTSVTIRALGIYPESTVKRGPDWNHGDQDGGSGQVGIVKELKNYGSDGSQRNGVTVIWPNKQTNTYKIGYRGKVDLTCVEESPGTYYYRDHLQPLSTVLSGKTTDSVGARSPPLVVPSKTPLKPGDMACVDLPEDALKAAQKGHGGWSMRMADYIGQVGKVKEIEDNGDVLIKYGDKEWKFFSRAVRKVAPVKVGDIVRIERDMDKVNAMQRKHGGWSSDMAQALGRVGKVLKIDSDGDVAVQFVAQVWVFSPACCEPAPGCKPDYISEGAAGATGGSGGGATGRTGSTESSGSGGSGGGASDGKTGSGKQSTSEDDAAEMLQKLARLMLFDAVVGAQLEPAHLVSAAGKGDVRAVRSFLSKKPALINQPAQGVTALVVASHKGFTEVVNVLLEAGADVNKPDHKGNTPLMAALMKKQETVADTLMQKGANVNAVTKNGRSALHAAAINEANRVLRTLLQKGCNPNQQDDAGDTPLHDAIHANNNSGFAFLVADPRVNFSLCNRKGLNLLHFAAFKDDELTAAKILGIKPSIVDLAKPDGNTALHIAALNDHVGVAKVLLKFKAEVNALTSSKHTPLHLACHRGYPKLVDLLLDNSAVIGCPDTDGDTPLHLAIMGSRNDDDSDNLLARMLGLRTVNQQETQDRIRAACLLIQKGASLTARNHQGRTPLEQGSNDRVRQAVKDFADRHGPQQTDPRARSQRNPFEELLGMLMPCAGCHGKRVDAILHPCSHKVLCKQCSFRVRECPVCNQRITKRTDLRGNELVMQDPCKVQ